VEQIVIWRRFYPAKDGIGAYWEHNHITEDLRIGAYPVGICEQQCKNWSKGTWRPYKGVLTGEHRVVYESH